jgi:hypothetical protein
MAEQNVAKLFKTSAISAQTLLATLSWEVQTIVMP